MSIFFTKQIFLAFSIVTTFTHVAEKVGEILKLLQYKDISGSTGGALGRARQGVRPTFISGKHARSKDDRCNKSLKGRVLFDVGS